MATKAGRYDEVLFSTHGTSGTIKAMNADTVQVEVFNSDGTTNATLYDDRDKTAYSGTGSIVTPDSAGNIEFFADPGIYVLEISDDGTVLRTDTVNVSVDGTEAADFPSLSSDETVTGTWSFPTANIDTLRTKGPVYDVTHPDYGITNATSASANATALQSAIDAAEASGGTVLLPDFEVSFDTALTIDTNGVEVRGHGPASSILTYTGGAADAITVSCGALVNLVGFRLKNTGSGTNGIVFGHSASSTGFRYEVRNVQVDDFGTHGLHLKNVELSHFEQLNVSGSGSHGIAMDNSTHTGSALGISNVFVRCRSISNTGSGWQVDDQEAAHFVGCQALTNATPQMNITGSCRGVVVERLDAENDGTGVGLAVSGSEHYLSVTANNLATGISLASCTGSVLMPSKFATVTTPVTLDASSTDNVAFGTNYTVTDNGSNNTILHTGARGSKIGSSWLRIQDGTAGVPGLSFVGDTDTGILREGANWLSIATGGTRRFGFDTTRFFTTSGTEVEIGGDLDHNGTNAGFFGATPVAQQTAPAALTDSTGGTTDDTLAAISGSGADADINNNFAELAEDIGAIRTALVNLGLIA